MCDSIDTQLRKKRKKKYYRKKIEIHWNFRTHANTYVAAAWGSRRAQPWKRQSEMTINGFVLIELQ